MKRILLNVVRIGMLNLFYFVQSRYWLRSFIVSLSKKIGLHSVLCKKSYQIRFASIATTTQRTIEMHNLTERAVKIYMQLTTVSSDEKNGHQK